MYVWGWVIIVIFAMDYYQNQLNNFLLLSAIWGAAFSFVEFGYLFGMSFPVAAAMPAVAGSLMYDAVYSHHVEWTRAIIIFLVAYLYYFYSYHHLYAYRHFYSHRKKQK